MSTDLGETEEGIILAVAVAGDKKPSLKRTLLRTVNPAALRLRIYIAATVVKKMTICGGHYGDLSEKASAVYSRSKGGCGVLGQIYY